MTNITNVLIKTVVKLYRFENCFSGKVSDHLEDFTVRAIRLSQHDEDYQRFFFCVCFPFRG